MGMALCTAGLLVAMAIDRWTAPTCVEKVELAPLSGVAYDVRIMARKVLVCGE